MDEEYRCDVHGERATAFCRVHKTLLCTRCFVQNTHQVEDCEISEMKDLSSTDKLYLTIKSLESFIKEKDGVRKTEQKSLIDLHEALKNQVEKCFQDLHSKLGKMKENTLDYLKRSIDKRNNALGRRYGVLSESKARVLQYMRDIETEPDRQDIGNIKRELKQLKTRVDDHTHASSKPVEGTFNQLSKYFTTTDVLGDFEFSDEPYVVVDELNLRQVHGDQVCGNSALSGHTNFDTVESDDYGCVAGKMPPSISSDGDIKCERSTPSNQCVIKKIDVLSDKRVVVLDTNHRKLLLLDHDGHIIQEFVENGTSVKMIDFCAIKDVLLVVLGNDATGTFISEVVFAKNALNSKSKNYLAGNQLQQMLQHVILFCFETGILQNTYVIGFADRIVKYKAGKIDKVVSLDDKLVQDPTTVQSIYDFQTNVIFILDKGNGRIVHYDCKDKKAIWTFTSKTESFRPLAMYKVKKEFLLLCPGRILWICKYSGQVLYEKEIAFSKDLVSFCVDGKAVIATYGTSGGVFRIVKHPNALIKQKN